MVTVIIVGIVILSLVLIGWIWVSLGNIEKQKKILYIICGIFITWIITFIIYNISKIGIVYENQEIMKTIRKVFVLVFTIINGYVLLPYTFKIFDKINNEEPFYTLNYAGDCLSYGDEIRCCELYKCALNYYEDNSN